MGINRRTYKNAQAFSTEVIGALVVFIVVIVFFYGLITLRTTDMTLNTEAERVNNNIPTIGIFQDGVLTVDELTALSRKEYPELQSLFGTTTNVCIYFRDQQGHLITLPQNKDSNVTIGCPGVDVTSWKQP